MNFLCFIPLFYISHPRLHSNKNWREPRALNLRNPGRPVYDLYEKNQDFLVAQEQKLGAKGHRALLEYSPVISPEFAALLFFSFVFHSTVLYLSSLLFSLPYSSFLLSLILLFFVLSPPRLRCRGNLTPVSNVIEAAPKSLFWASNGCNKLPEMRFKFPFNLIGKSTMALFNRPIMASTPLLVHRWGPRTRISALFHRRS